MKFIPWILFAAAIGVIFLMRSCQTTPATIVKTDTVWQHSVDTVHDSVPVPYKVLVNGRPQLITYHDTVIVSEYLPVDTIQILGDYFASRSYKDTLRHKYGFAIIDNTVTQNKLVSQSAIFDFNIPETHSTIIEAKRKGYLGLDVGFGNQFAMGGLRFTYIDRKDNMFHLGGDYTTGNFFLISGGVDWKISLFK